MAYWAAARIKTGAAYRLAWDSERHLFSSRTIDHVEPRRRAAHGGELRQAAGSLEAAGTVHRISAPTLRWAVARRSPAML